MVDSLCQNSSLFPEYNSNQAPDMTPDKTVYYQNGLTISTGAGQVDPDLARYIFSE